MSALLEVLNGVRESATPDWLTPAQRQSYAAILALARVYTPSVLLGPAGSGKTLIGWLLRRGLGFGYVADPDRLPNAEMAQRGIVIDNADLADGGARQLLAGATLHGWTTAVLLARSIDPGGIPTIHLTEPTESDIIACLSNLPFPLHNAPVCGETNLWRVLRGGLSRIGEGCRGGQQ